MNDEKEQKNYKIHPRWIENSVQSVKKPTEEEKQKLIKEIV